MPARYCGWCVPAAEPPLPSTHVKAALKSHCSAAQGVLQTLDRAMVSGVCGVLLVVVVVAHQILKLVFARIECAGTSRASPVFG